MRENLKALTSLRFFAAAALVVHHTSWYFGYGTALASAFPLDLGVSFFFVLSGFVLTYAHPDIPTLRAAAGFITARVARIWPAHLAMLLAIVIFLPYPWNTGPISPGMRPPFIENAFLLQSWSAFPGSFFSFNGVSWSISTELFFYAMFPLLIWRWDTTKWVKLLLSSMMAAACVFYATKAGLPFLSDQDSRSIDGAVYIFPAARLFEFVMGMLTATAWRQYKDRLAATATVLQAIAAALAMLGVPAMIHLYGVLYEHGYLSNAATKWLDESGSAPIFAFAIFAMALSRGHIARALSADLPVLLGEISFSIYMTHQVLIRALTFNRNLSAFGSMPVQYLTYWTLVLLLSFLLWAFIEKPSRRYIVGKVDELFPPKQQEETAPNRINTRC